MSFSVVAPAPAPFTPLAVTETDRDAQQRHHDEAARRRRQGHAAHPQTPDEEVIHTTHPDPGMPRIGLLLDVRA